MYYHVIFQSNLELLIINGWWLWYLYEYYWKYSTYLTEIDLLLYRIIYNRRFFIFIFICQSSKLIVLIGVTKITLNKWFTGRSLWISVLQFKNQSQINANHCDKTNNSMCYVKLVGKHSHSSDLLEMYATVILQQIKLFSSYGSTFS